MLMILQVRVLSPRQYSDKIVYWVISWPFSVIESLVGDFIDVISKLVSTVFRNMHARVSANAMKEIDDLDE